MIDKNVNITVLVTRRLPTLIYGHFFCGTICNTKLICLVSELGPVDLDWHTKDDEPGSLLPFAKTSQNPQNLSTQFTPNIIRKQAENLSGKTNLIQFCVDFVHECIQKCTPVHASIYTHVYYVCSIFFK